MTDCIPHFSLSSLYCLFFLCPNGHWVYTIFTHYTIGPVKKRFIFLLYNIWGGYGGVYEFMDGRVKMKGKDERFIGSNHRSIMTI